MSSVSSRTGSQSNRRPSFGILGAPLTPSTPRLVFNDSQRKSGSNKRRPSIELGRLGSMHALTPMLKDFTLKSKINVLFIGAGNINFGSDEGPWNHSVRLEHKLQVRLRVVGIIDPALERSQAVKDIKCASFVEKAYKDAKLATSLAAFVEGLAPADRPHAIVLGTPAQFHGSDIPGQDLELQCLKLFPDAALFVEKPISCAPVKSCYALAAILEKRKTVVSVGYMLRYLQVIQHMHQIIQGTGKPVIAVVARYVCSYAKIKSQVWWNKSLSLGPIVEQGTHLVDLCRYFGGEAILESVQATCTEFFEEAGHLEAIPIDESKIPEEHRVPRTTSALWKFENGGICSFTHALTLQGTKYSTELEVYLDGWQMKVVDLYNEPTLYVRSPESDAEQKVDFPSDDPYFGEISAWIDAIESKSNAAAAAAVTATTSGGDSAIADDDDISSSSSSSSTSDVENPKTVLANESEIESGILSTFTDACATYALTHAIKEASEKALKTKRCCC